MFQMVDNLNANDNYLAKPPILGIRLKIDVAAGQTGAQSGSPPG